MAKKLKKKKGEKRINDKLLLAQGNLSPDPIRIGNPQGTIGSGVKYDEVTGIKMITT